MIGSAGQLNAIGNSRVKASWRSQVAVSQQSFSVLTRTKLSD